MIENKDISALRREYSLKELSKRSVDKNPVVQFSIWMNEVIESNVQDATAMALATSNRQGFPSVRIVLLKGYSDEGFIFYTNYESDKAKDIKENSNVALLFLWKELERQVRICGSAEKISAEESQVYFNSRPFESRLGAWASKQSSIIPNREYLEEQFASYQKKFTSENIPLPPFWGGYLVVPNKIEFWQGRRNRLHDRILYTRKQDEWTINRLSP